MGWWTNKRFRMIQNNFRDIDACIDVEKYVQTLKEFGADVCMVGCGGITAFYPTALECQKESPYLQDDMLERLVEVCHENEIRVIARFDFSKTHTDFLESHPEWFCRTADGSAILFQDTAATCVNGPYQQECSLEILEEVLRNYEVDGVFFNMFGYQTRDYSGKYVGICRCESCRRRFYEYAGMELPADEKSGDAAGAAYRKFRKDTAQELLYRIHDRVKALAPKVAVCTYSSRGVDLVRSESNSAVDRPLPFWAMNSESNVARIRGTYEERFSSNCVINAMDIFWRFMGVSPWLNELRLWGNLAAGGNLDWCIIGDFNGYPDRRNFEGVKRVFSFHKKYESYLSRLTSVSKVLLVCPESGEEAQKEYFGIFKLLKEAHVLFDVTDASEQRILQEKAKNYAAIVLPGVDNIPEETVKALEECRAVLVGTGAALKENRTGLKRLFGVTLDEKPETVRGSYMLTEPKEIFKNFADRDWVYLDDTFYCMESEPENLEYLPLITGGMYGPPERCFGYRIAGKACVSLRSGRSVYFPWMVGKLYGTQGYEDIKLIFLDILKNECVLKSPVELWAPPCVELFFDRCGENQYLLQLLNYSGFNGMTFYEPLEIEARAVFCGLEVEKVQALDLGRKRKTEYDGELRISLKGLYRAFLVTGKER